jgi:hypothetical protein
MPVLSAKHRRRRRRTSLRLAELLPLGRACSRLLLQLRLPLARGRAAQGKRVNGGDGRARRVARLLRAARRGTLLGSAAGMMKPPQALNFSSPSSLVQRH